MCIVGGVGWRKNGLERSLRDLPLTDERTQVNNRRGFYTLARQWSLTLLLRRTWRNW